jgi:hypothetical protein
MANTKRSVDERIADLKRKEDEIKAQKKKLLSQKSAEERKADTHHKIQLGGAVIKMLNRPFVDGDVERLIKFLQLQEDRGSYFTKAMVVPATQPENRTE